MAQMDEEARILALSDDEARLELLRCLHYGLDAQRSVAGALGVQVVLDLLDMGVGLPLASEAVLQDDVRARLGW